MATDSSVIVTFFTQISLHSRAIELYTINALRLLYGHTVQQNTHRRLFGITELWNIIVIVELRNSRVCHELIHLEYICNAETFNGNLDKEVLYACQRSGFLSFIRN